jgi:hypothetical protein
MGVFKDLSGQRFGRLIAICRTPESGRNKGVLWLCKCDCGNEIYVRSTMLNSRHTRSCGCYAKECVKTNSRTHGLCNTRLFRIWCLMRRRCNRPGNSNYRYYGGRGVRVCNEWNEGFLPFYNWAISNGYEDSLSIDRIDNDGNYEPSNCRWATISEQRNNMSSNKRHDVNGRSYTERQLSREYCIGYYALRYRLKAGWSLEDALSRLPRNSKPPLDDSS